MNDRLMKGAIAGTIAGIILSAWNYFSYYILHLAKERLIDMTGYLLYALKPGNAAEIILAQFAVLIFTAALGIAFAYFIALVGSRYYLIKAIFFSIVAFYLVFVLGTFYHVPTLEKIAWESTTSSTIGMAIYGLVLGWLLHMMDLGIENK